MNRILIVDDDPMIVDAVQALLSLHDIDAEAAWDCDTAEEMIASEFYPVILADLRLRSEDDGFRLLEAIRRVSPKSKVASMTAYADDATESRLRELGARLVLHKPVECDELVSVLREMLAEVERAEELHGDDLEQVYHATIDSLQAISRGRYRFPTEDAEELVQEAWLLFLEKRASIRAPKAWLSGTIANLCRQEIERRSRERARGDELPELPFERPDDDVLTVRQALSKLDERSRTLCEMIGLEQRSYDEVSALAELPIGSVGPLYMRAKARLRRAIAN